MNKYGLTRAIPEPVKREVRQRAGFGCVICGKAVGDYDHLDPPFHEARAHDPQGIVYLCIEHHGLKTRRQLSEATIRHHAANPAALQKGFSFGAFDMQSDRPILHVGSNKSDGCLNFIRVNQRPILSIKLPEIAGGPFLLNAHFQDVDGKTTLRIVDNEWYVDSDTWDLQTVGQRITIYSAPRTRAAIIITDPPNNFYVEVLNMSSEGYRILTDGKWLAAIIPGHTEMSVGGTYISEALSVIDIEKDYIGIGAVRD